MSTAVTFAPQVVPGYLAIPLDGTAYYIFTGYARPDFTPFSMPLYDPNSVSQSTLFISDYFLKSITNALGQTQSFSYSVTIWGIQVTVSLEGQTVIESIPGKFYINAIPTITILGMLNIYANVTAYMDPVFGQGFGEYAFTITPKVSNVKFTDAAITLLGLKLDQEFIVNSIVWVFEFFVQNLLPVMKFQKSTLLNFEMKKASVNFMNDWTQVDFELK